MTTATAPLELKLAPVPADGTDADAEATGAFTGYASTPDLDRSRDRIAPGAWEATLAVWAKRGGRIPLLFQHDQQRPVGAITRATAGERGLEVEGQIAIHTPAGQVAYELAKVGGLSLSIGYTLPEGGARRDPATGIRTITAIDLWEVSMVSVPDNAAAIITGIKSAADCRTIKEFERLVRKALGLSQRRAKAVASVSWDVLHRDGADVSRDGEMDEQTAQAAIGLLRKSTQAIKR